MTESSDSTVPDVATDMTDSSLEGRIGYLRRTPFLQYASDALVRRLAEAMQVLEVPATTRIVEKGDEGDTMFFVISGEVRVHDGEVELSVLGKGAMFGEIAALSPQRRTASITALCDSLLCSISQESLYRVLHEQPEAARSIIQGLCEHESRFVREMTDRTVQMKVLEHELEIGQRIQKGFLPGTALEVAGWDIESHFKAAREVAGDFYDYFEIRSCGGLAIVLGDVCDKGVGAALFMTLFRSLLRSSALSFDYAGKGDGPDRRRTAVPGFDDILSYAILLVNQYVATTHANDSMFATLFFALINPKTGEFSYINAGHEAPCLLAPDGTIRRLESTGPVVGLFVEAKYGVSSDRISTGEILLSFTDGISEAKNKDGEEFGDERVLAALTSVDSGANEAVSALVSAVNGFVGSAKQFDDITVLAVERQQ